MNETPKEKIISLLESFVLPVYLQGSLAEDAPYPEAFFTFWNNSSLDNLHYDNVPVSYVWNFDVNFYSSDPLLVNTKTQEAIDLLRQNGWIISGKGFDIPSGEITHTGRGFNALYLEF